MSPQARQRTTDLLLAWSEGDQEALAALMPRVYAELHSLAASYLRRERPGHTLETSALVHEAFLRLVDQNRMRWQGRAHFFGIAAQMMRRVLVDHARSLLYSKRGGGVRPLSLDAALTLSAERAPEWVALDDALEALARIDPQKARIVELRFFAGLTSEEIARILGVSVPTVTRGWRLARAWLYRNLSEADGRTAAAGRSEGDGDGA